MIIFNKDRDDSEGKDLGGVDHNNIGQNSALIGVSRKFEHWLSNNSSGKDWVLTDNAEGSILGIDTKVRCETGDRASTSYHPSGVQRGDFNVYPS